ncbi:hypothetical protein GWI33_022044 [Rhynchophorus ferrugineus]|uniref:Uncharacterized protein n=1 Tax=Rhynchophorus ferrugineus TaxID=354439 RepID=A0A834IQD0_RHYFE|nr:hypothetical protein GWI33_022044 [Rhynchophorus ferrugineus]
MVISKIFVIFVVILLHCCLVSGFPASDTGATKTFDFGYSGFGGGHHHHKPGGHHKPHKPGHHHHHGGGTGVFYGNPFQYAWQSWSHYFG